LQVSRRLATRAGVPLDPAETPFELVERARPSVGGAVAADLEVLATLVTEARWSPGGLSEPAQARLDALAERVVAAIDHPAPAPA
ncbi:MAG TPA: DUF4129 domain-containing protein, partial [Acidimicrobiales bacterium]|nr:DUF4129 domain-containing protein [Acidimicrobiales bacterium]